MPNVTITIEDSLLERAKQTAKANCRSLSQQVAFLILQDEGNQPKPARKGGNMRKGALV
jgi:hypothetical protein